jgi:nucleotide-binding universal stress UspA family protein
MSKDENPVYSDGKAKSSDESNISKVNPEKDMTKEIEEYPISKNKLPLFKKILVTDDGKDISNKALNYAVYLSNSTGAELFILRILQNVEKLGNISFEGSHEISQMDNQDYHRKIKGDVINAMEEKIKKCKEAGCENKITYKFLTGNVVDEIVDEINNNNYDLVVMLTFHIDSWFRSLFSDVQKIINHIRKPVMIIQ